MPLSKQASALSWDLMELGRKAKGKADLTSLTERTQKIIADLGTVAGLRHEPLALSSVEARLGTAVFRFISDEKLEDVKDLAAKSQQLLMDELSSLNQYKNNPNTSLLSLQRNLTQIAHALRSTGL
jgi:hypothetical protein